MRHTPKSIVALLIITLGTLLVSPLTAQADTVVERPHGVRQIICNGPCAAHTDVLLPSLLIDKQLMATIGPMLGRQVGKSSYVVIYPMVGIGTYNSAPGLQIEGHF